VAVSALAEAVVAGPAVRVDEDVGFDGALDERLEAVCRGIWDLAHANAAQASSPDQFHRNCNQCSIYQLVNSEKSTDQIYERRPHDSQA
jgi:hypothetical protein